MIRSKELLEKKAAMFVIREGVMYKKEGLSTYAAWALSQNNSLFILRVNLQVVEVQLVRNRREQLKILEACHFEPTAGHMGEKRTIARITERFIWSGVVNDVKEMASKLLKFHLNTSFYYYSYRYAPVIHVKEQTEKQ